MGYTHKLTYISDTVLASASSETAQTDSFGTIMLWICLIFLIAFAIAAIALILFYKLWDSNARTRSKSSETQIQTIHTDITTQASFAQETSSEASAVSALPAPAPALAPPPLLALPAPASVPALSDSSMSALSAPPQSPSSGSPRVPFLGNMPVPAAQSYSLCAPLLPPSKKSKQLKLGEAKSEALQIGRDSHPEQRNFASIQDAERPVAEPVSLATPNSEQLPASGGSQKDGRYTETFPKRAIG